MTAVKASFTGDYRYRTTSLKVLKEIDMDHESNSSSSEDSEYYSPKSVFVKKLPMTMKEVSVSRARVHNPILRIRAEDRQIGEDIGEVANGGSIKYALRNPGEDEAIIEGFHQQYNRW
ncbi:hypothetical protein E3N88_06896 [Mikania micrantha]|uniref:Uncharacterized protein n=1 Tax=Mikania micrantha TaxID=192012 RepID=A0A5N6PSE5_9ASTR|nr:hypothetical protein E3N88_06896 [Mikania micrantha]